MKIISFSLWGDNESYLTGALENCQLANDIYPGWTVWMFVEKNCPKDWKPKLEAAGALVTEWEIGRGEWEGLFTRFHPIWSPEVEITLVRDTDSRLNPREKAAVDAWLATDLRAHTMRDHIEHQVPMLGGMIGFRHWPEFREHINGWHVYCSKGVDQDFLTHRIWPILTRDKQVLAHDKFPQGTTIEIDEGPYKEYKYDPIQFFGDHRIEPFPEHDPLGPEHGEHVGARVGI